MVSPTSTSLHSLQHGMKAPYTCYPTLDIVAFADLFQFEKYVFMGPFHQVPES